MGNLLFSLLSNIFLEKMEERIEKEGIIPPLWVRYVDMCDVLAVVKKQDATSLLASLNNIHRKIAFTIETEVDQSLTCLDVIIIHKAEKLKVKVK